MSTRAELLIHPVRLRILQALAGRTLTTAGLRDRVPDVPQATLYRHIDRLLDAGVLAVVDERQARGAVERTYALVEGTAHVGADELAGATHTDHVTWFATWLAGLLDQFDRYLETSGSPEAHPADPDAPITLDLEADAVSYRQVPLWLDDDEARALLEDLREVLRPRLELGPTPNRRRRLVSIVSMPEA